MDTMKKYIYLFIQLTFTAEIAFAQTLPLQTEVFAPQLFQEKTIKESDIENFQKDANWGQKKPVTNKKYWVVYSDRSENPAYTLPQVNSPIKTKLNFNQEVRIARIENGYALVYEDKLNDYPNISKFAKPLGWVHMSKLLLWNSCPTNDAGIYNKALISAHITKETDKNKEMKFYKLFKNPEMETSENIAPTMDFYFIMKKLDNDMVLLAKECKMDGASNQVLVGWMEKTSYVPWNQRSCIEPTWSPKDVEQFVANNTRVGVYYEPEMITDVLNYDFGKPNKIGESQFDSLRMSPNVLRYPILDYKSGKDKVYKCNAFGLIDGAMNEAILLRDSIIAIKNSGINMVKNMNLIICIDGTKSMEPYFPAVEKAINEAMKYVPDNQNLKVGIVIYRDYTDGAGVVEYLPLLSPKDSRIPKFLKGGSYGIKSSEADHTFAEALYKGIETAIDPEKMGFKTEHSNFLLVVGDCGNDENDKKCLSSSELLNRMIKNNVQVMSFQVFRKNDYAWSLFNDQMSSLIQENVQKRYDRLGTGVKVAYNELSNGYDLNSENSEQMYLGSIRYGRLNEPMKGEELKDLIVESVNTFTEYINKTIAIINDIDNINIDVINTTVNEDNVTATTNAARLREIIGKDNYSMIKKINGLFSYIGYTPKTDIQDRNYWKPVIFISSDEFDRLVEKLEPVYNAALNDSNDRKPYVEAMKALLRSMLPDISETEMNAKGTQEVMNLITGLNVEVGSKASKGYTLMQIQDPKSVSHQDYIEIIRNFTLKYKGLKKIKSRGYNFIFQSNNIKYYWIPLEDLP